jgi:hypothetical protein
MHLMRLTSGRRELEHLPDGRPSATRHVRNSVYLIGHDRQPCMKDTRLGLHVDSISHQLSVLHWFTPNATGAKKCDDRADKLWQSEDQ